MMLRPKSSRSAYGDLGDKSHESVNSRIFSASKFCRGDNIGKSVDSNALKSFGRTCIDKNPSKSARFTESQLQKALMVQEHMGQLEQELKWAKDQIFIVEEERKRDAKRAPVVKLNESLPTKKVGELMTEIKTLKEELRTKDKVMESLRKELEQAKQFEFKLSESDFLLNVMKEDMNKVQESEAFAMNQLLSSKKKIEDLEDEVQRGKESEAKFEESKLKIAALNQKIISLGTLIKHVASKGSEKKEVEFLKKELMSALDAEEKSQKAMDELALVLKEVKGKLFITESNLENSKSEAEQLKKMVRNTEEKYKKLLDEAKKETELYKNTIKRLRIEAEETVLAWNGKEMGFVDCIKRGEDQNNSLNESLKSAENTIRTVKDDNNKLRDILKQAINEANAAKATATIAINENSKLKDCLTEKAETLRFLTRENEKRQSQMILTV